MPEFASKQKVLCFEHERLLRGEGSYVDDIKLPNTVHAAFVRSPYAHARVLRVDTQAALSDANVLRVMTGKELRLSIKPIRALLKAPHYQATDWHPLAWEKVRYVGEAVAVVVAKDRYCAEDAAARVQVEYEPLPVLVNPVDALKADSPRVHEELPTNILFQVHIETEEERNSFRRAEVRVQATFQHPRVTGLALENCGVLADYHRESDELVVWASTQTPHLLRDLLSQCLDYPANRLRVVCPEVGGGFGIKMHGLPEQIVIVYLATCLARPVKWIQDRSENLRASIHARDVRVEAELAAQADGTIIGLRAKAVCDVGAYSTYPVTCALEPYTIAGALPGPYRFKYFAYDGYAVASNKCPVGAYRGVGYVMGPLVMEGLMDRLANTLAMDPAELRLKNLIQPEELPFRSPSGPTYDSGNYPALLRLALKEANYESWRDQQNQARAIGRRLGIGMACFVEPTASGRSNYRKRGLLQTPGFDAAVIRLGPGGELEAYVSTPSQGQGQLTALAQLLGKSMGVSPDSIKIHAGDTLSCPYGSGTFSSRSVVSGGGALLKAAAKLRQKLIQIAASYWETDEEKVTFTDVATLHNVPPQRLTLRDLGGLAYTPSQELPSGCEPGLEVHCAYDPPTTTSSAAVHLVLLELDPETGQVSVLRYFVAEDCGPMLNPQLVDGQIRGGVAQGIGAALLEELVYADTGELLTASLMDYLPPGSCEVPRIEIVHLETPSPWTEGGLKGMGESGTIGAPAAMTNAILDALQSTVKQIQLPFTPERVLRLKTESSVF